MAPAAHPVPPPGARHSQPPLPQVPPPTLVGPDELDGLFVEFHDGLWTTLKVAADAIGGFPTPRDLKDALMGLGRVRGLLGAQEPHPWVRDATAAEIAVLKARRQLGRNACRAQLCSREGVFEIAGGMREVGLASTRRRLRDPESDRGGAASDSGGAGPVLPGATGDDDVSLVGTVAAGTERAGRADVSTRERMAAARSASCAEARGQVGHPGGAGGGAAGATGATGVDDTPLTELVWDPSAAPQTIEPLDQAAAARIVGSKAGKGLKFTDPEIDAFISTELAAFDAWYSRSRTSVVLSRPGNVGTSSAHTRDLTAVAARQVLFINKELGVVSRSGWRTLLSPTCLSNFVGFMLATGKEPATCCTYLERMVPIIKFCGATRRAAIGFCQGVESWVKRVCTHFRAAKKRKDRDTIVEMKERGG